MSTELRALATEIRGEIDRSQRAVAECRDGFNKMMLAAEFGALCKILLCVNRAAQGMAPEGRGREGGPGSSELPSPVAESDAP